MEAIVDVLQGSSILPKIIAQIALLEDSAVTIFPLNALIAQLEDSQIIIRVQSAASAQKELLPVKLPQPLANYALKRHLLDSVESASFHALAMKVDTNMTLWGHLSAFLVLLHLVFDAKENGRMCLMAITGSLED
jgi:hypothetical protein